MTLVKMFIGIFFRLGVFGLSFSLLDFILPLSQAQLCTRRTAAAANSLNWALKSSSTFSIWACKHVPGDDTRLLRKEKARSPPYENTKINTPKNLARSFSSHHLRPQRQQNVEEEKLAQIRREITRLGRQAKKTGVAHRRQLTI